MRDLRRLGAVVWGLAAAGSAHAMPWHIDLADSAGFKAYETVMRPLPEGVMSQQHLLTPISYRRNYVRESAEGQALVNPLGSDEATLALGERMYGIYCTPCHAGGGEVGPVGYPGRYPAIAILSGPNGRVKDRTDGHLYLTIRNGGGIMPSYGWAMNDDEMWSIVSYLRTLPNSKAPPPPAPVTETPADGGAE